MTENPKFLRNVLIYAEGIVNMRLLKCESNY